MFQRLLLIALLLATLPVAAASRPDNSSRRPEPLDGSTPWLRSTTPTREKAAVDTFYVLGGPDRLDGKFEAEDGAPDWHGWTSHDISVPTENHWHTSTYWAEGLNGHGPGNYALVCVDESLPACSEADTIGGVGHNWFDDIGWIGTVSDPSQPVTVRLTASMHYDLVDAGWDFLELFIQRGETKEMLAQWTGSAYGVAVDTSAVFQPEDLTGPYGDQVRIFWRVWSDGGWDDEDCTVPSHGACQIDDISIFFNETLMTFDDFEPGSPMNWSEGDFSGVGDFAKLRSNLPDLDNCRQNTSSQVSFIDDGVVVPGTGGTLCETWCYGRGGYILNNDGGLLADDSQAWFLENQIHSAVYAWIPGTNAAELAFDAYKHETLCASCPGIFYLWGVRSTASADPADIELAPWKDRNFVHYGGPEYFRQIEPISDLIVQDAKWVQVMIEVNEMGWLWGWNGTNGTPAPYFDNVALKAWAAEGPEILVSGLLNFMDSFPEQGSLDPVDLASNWCRIDIARDLDLDEARYDAGDSLVAKITPMSPGAALQGVPEMHWVLACNPDFNVIRPTAPGGDNILRGAVAGSEVYNISGNLVPNEWAFDLPDTGWFYPGDRLRYYITATDLGDAGLKTSVWPADTTGVLDFSYDSSYPDFGEVRALPSLTVPSPGVFSQPALLFCDDTGDAVTTGRVLRSLTELGFIQGTDYDHFRVSGTTNSTYSGMAASGTSVSLAGYETIVLDGGARTNGVLSEYAYTPDDVLFDEWLDLGGKNALLAGDGLFSGIANNPNNFFPRFGIELLATDLSAVNGGYGDLRINPVAGNGILPDGETWMVNALCPAPSRLDGIAAGITTVSLATLDPVGQTGGAYSAAIAQTDTVLSNKIGMLPFSLRLAATAPENPVVGDPNFSARTLLLKYFLDWFGDSGSGPYSAVPEVRALTLRAAPNPFNPRTTIEFELPHAATVTLDIFDLQGRRVRRLVNEGLSAGPHSRVWNGQDGKGRQAPSGIYFYRFDADQQRLQGKLTLLK